MSAEIKDFAEAILQDKPNPIAAMEGASTIAVCCATVEAAKLGQPVQIKYPEI
jgi:predicted dehydrogenase